MLWTPMTCWGKWNAMWHFISTLFCWCLSTVETLIEQLYETWDVQSCLFTLKLVVQRKEWSRSLALRSSLRHVTAQTREPELISATRVNACVYTSTFLNRPRSGSPRHLYSDLSCHIKHCQNAIYYLNFLKEKNKKQTVFVRYTCVPNRKIRRETCTVTPLIYIQSWPKISPPLVNMIKEGCEN